MSQISAACPWSPATLASSGRGSCKHIPGRIAARSVLVLLGYLLLSCLAGLGLAQSIDDPVERFCRRFGHQTALIDRKLYIDGGTINYNPLTENKNTNRTNTFLSYIDLDVNGAKDMPQLYANLSKNASIPSVSGGVLWADDVNKMFHLFGGEYPDDPTNAISLYSYDAINDYWTTPSRAPPQSIQGVSYGAGVAISERGEGYYYGGWLSPKSTAGWNGRRMATTGLVQYTMDTNQWANNSGPADNIGRAEGVMVYLPISDQGMLVYFGGIQDQRNDSFVGQPMDEIHLYDLATSRWYVQHADGYIPEMRRLFCAGATWPDDQSSFNIYLYGGLGFGNESAGFDDVYILSLPSFTWIKMYPAPGSNAQQYPHNMLSCNVIDKGQMLIIGGSFPLDKTTCDAPEQFGEHGLDMGLQNSDKSPWFVYRKNITDYVVPGPITNEIGGNEQGRATKMEPTKGFDAADLKILMTRRYTPEKRLPSRVLPDGSGGGSSLSTGAIVGIAVGASAAVLLGVFACCWFCVRRHKRRKAATAATAGGATTETSDHYGKPHGPPSTTAIYSHDGSNVSGLGSPRSLSSYHHTPASPAFSSQYTPQMPSRPAELAGDDALYEVDAPQPTSPENAAAMTPKASVRPGMPLDHSAGQAGFTTELPAGQVGGMTWNDGSPHENSQRQQQQQQGLTPKSGYAANHGASGLGLPSPDRPVLATGFSDGDDRGGSPDTRPRPHQTYYHK